MKEMKMLCKIVITLAEVLPLKTVEKISTYLNSTVMSRMMEKGL